MRKSSVITLVALAFRAGTPVSAAGAQQQPIAGHWTLNRTQSDDPREQQQACERRVRTSGTPEVPDVKGTGIALGTPVTLSEKQHERLDQTMELALDTPFSLTILVASPTVTFAAEDRDTLVLHSDHRKAKQAVDGRGDLVTTAYWQGSALIVEQQVDGGGKVTTSYLRSQDGKQLYVVVAFEGRCGQFQFRRVYDQGTE